MTEPSTSGSVPSAERQPASLPAEPPRRHFRFTLKLLLFAAVLYYFVVPILPDFRDAWADLRRVEPILLAIGLGLELIALYCYAPLMKAARWLWSKMVPGR